MSRNPPPIPDENAPATPGEARFEALLEERFSPARREDFAGELARHDRTRAPAAFDPGAVRRALRFRGEVPEQVRRLLGEWLPPLLAHAHARDLVLRGGPVVCEVLTREAMEAGQGPLPAGLKLPASSFRFDPRTRRYEVRLVLSERLATNEALFTVLRAILTRTVGDIFLREEVYAGEPYRQDLERSAGEVSVGLAEQVDLLAEVSHTSAALESALESHARLIGLNYRRQPGQARKAYFKELRADLERQRLPAERQALVEETFLGYLAALRADTPAEVGALLEVSETLNRQLTFLPPAEGPEYERLRSHHPLHFLRSVKLRLEFLLEAFAGLGEDFDALAGSALPLSPLAGERVGGWLAQLEREGLARPHLATGVRLSDELQRKRTAFPLEVHALMARFPPTEDADKLFRTLSKKLESALHQRLYQALLLLRHWIHLHERGRGEDFPRSPQFQTLKGLVANFRFRLPLLRALFVRSGVVLDVAESGAEALPGEERRVPFPVEDFGRAWGRFVAHAVLAGHLAERRLKGFDAERYWEQVNGRLRAHIDEGRAVDSLGCLLERLYARAGGDDGLPVLVALARECPPSFRFAVVQALRPPPDKLGEAWLAQLDAWADSVLRARESSLANAIVVKGAGGA